MIKYCEQPLAEILLLFVWWGIGYRSAGGHTITQFSKGFENIQGGCLFWREGEWTIFSQFGEISRYVQALHMQGFSNKLFFKPLNGMLY